MSTAVLSSNSGGPNAAGSSNRNIASANNDQGGLSKTERRRLAKKRKKERQQEEKPSSTSAPQETTTTKKKAKRKKNGAKPTPMTKEERREKYTKLAHEKREAKNMKKRDADTICFKCRQKGHSAMNCPNTENADGTFTSSDTCIPVVRGGSGANGGYTCYRCGSTEHRLQDCPKKKLFPPKNQKKDDAGDASANSRYGYLPFANCFICGGIGHVSSQCSKNTNGVFAKGFGSCRLCGSKQHIAAYCPESKNKKPLDEEEDGIADVDIDFVVDNTRGGDDQPAAIDQDDKRSTKKRRKKVVSF